MQVDSGRPRVAPPGHPRSDSLVDAVADAVPVVYRYLLAGTGGDEAVAEDLAATTIAVAVSRHTSGDDGALALGRLLDVARSVLIARVSPLDAVRAVVAEPASRGGADPSAAALRRLPLGHRVVAALHHHDLLPVGEVADAVGRDEATVAAVLADVGRALGRDPDDLGEPLWDVYHRRVDPPAGLLDLVLADLPAADRGSVPEDDGGADANGSEGGPFGSEGTPVAADRGASELVDGSAATVRSGTGPVVGDGAIVHRRIAARPGPVPVAVPREAEHDRGEPVGTDTAGDVPAAEVAVVLDDTPGLPHSATSEVAGGRVRRGGSRPWGAVALVVALVVGLVTLGAVDRADDPPADDPSADDPSADRPSGEAADGAAGAGDAGDATPPPARRFPDGPAAGAVSRASAGVPVLPLAPPPAVGRERPATTARAAVEQQVRLGPGGAYMNGPFSVAAGDEGLWAAAVGDDGTWRAARVDPATGAVLAEIRIPGRIPSDPSHHGIALSGGYVWTPALQDGIFRIDATSNTASGIIGVAGGVVGSAMDAGEGAVWAVGHDAVLRRIDARTTELTATADIPEMGVVPGGVDLAHGGGTVWVTVADAGVRHLIGFDPTSLARRWHYTVPPVGAIADAHDIAVIGDRVVITEAWPGGVTVVDGGTGRVVLQQQLTTAGIAVEGDRAWVLAPEDGLATVVLPRTGALLGTTAVPVGLETMAPVGGGVVWAANPASGELVRLRLPGWPSR